MPAREADAVRTVAHVVENLDVGGLERVVIDLALSVDPQRYRCVLYALGTGGALSPIPASRGCTVRAFARRRGVDWFLLPALSRALRADGVHVVHCHNYSPLFYGSVAARLARCAGVVYTAHGAKTSARRSTRRFQRLNLVDRIVFVSEDARRVALASGSVDDDGRVSVVVNGIDAASYQRGPETRRRMRSEFSIPDDAPVAGIVARLSAAKDHVNLFDAFVSVRSVYGRARLLVVGDGELREALRGAAQERGLGGAVIFTGRRDDVADLLSALDVFVLSSATEGHAVTLLEAMAAGLPVVATRVGGNAEVVADGETGFLVPPRDPETLAARIGELFSDRERAARIGETGRERVRSRFARGLMSERYQELYDGLVRGARAPKQRGA